jgi:two-component system CheB/CheR fusion protein
MAARKTSSKSGDAPELMVPAPSVNPRFPVVGIGASAGGLEAVTSLVQDLAPNLGIAYVLVLHLDPARESKVSEILARKTPMPVVQAQEGLRVEPDHVYVIPPNCEMIIDHWVLRLKDREAHRSANTTIDTFLRSLAVAHERDCFW